MNGLLNMNSRRIENLANPRSGEADGIPYEYFRQWYMDFDDNNIKINVENPVNMKNKNINNNLKKGSDDNDLVNKYQLQTRLNQKADKTELNNYI